MGSWQKGSIIFDVRLLFHDHDCINVHYENDLLVDSLAIYALIIGSHDHDYIYVHCENDPHHFLAICQYFIVDSKPVSDSFNSSITVWTHSLFKILTFNPP